MRRLFGIGFLLALVAACLMIGNEPSRAQVPPGTGGCISFNGSGQASNNCAFILQAYIVSTLPSCTAARAGAQAYVTDASSPTYNGTLTGGSSTTVPVFCNGSAWTSH